MKLTPHHLMTDDGRAVLRARALEIAGKPLDSPQQRALRAAIAKAATQVSAEQLPEMFHGLEELFDDPGQRAQAHQAAIGAAIGRLTQRHSSTGYSLTTTDFGTALMQRQEQLEEAHRVHVAAAAEAKLNRTALQAVCTAAADAVGTFVHGTHKTMGLQGLTDRSPAVIDAILARVFGEGNAAIIDNQLVWQRSDGSAVILGAAHDKSFTLSAEADGMRNRAIGEALWLSARRSLNKPRQINNEWESWHEYYGYPSVKGDVLEAMVGYSAPPMGTRPWPVYFYNNVLYNLREPLLRGLLRFDDSTDTPVALRWTSEARDGNPAMNHALFFVSYSNKYDAPVAELCKRMHHADAATVSALYHATPRA